MREVPQGIDREALTRFMQQVLPDPLRGPLDVELISGGKSNLTYRVTDGVHRWILRRPPLGRVLPRAHDMLREHRLMAALAGSTVPVPRVVAVDDSGVMGVPFYLMDEVEGVVLRTSELVSAVPEPIRVRLSDDLVGTLADLHEIDYNAVGLGDLGRPEGYLDRQLRRWRRQYDAIQVRALEHVETIATTLNETLPARQGAGIVHGDYRLDNVIVSSVDHGRIAAVLDWELATLGDPLADLATLIIFWDEPDKPFNPITRGLMAFPGFPTIDGVVERYVSRRGIVVDDLDWYLTFARFKLAVILEQIHARHVEGNTVGPGFEDIGDMVVFLLDQAMGTIAASPVLARRSRRL